MEFLHVYEYDKPINEKEFVLALLKGLYQDPKCPTNLFDGLKIDLTEEYFEEIALFKGHVEADYTASIGYDRKEQYQTTERKYVSQGSYYMCNGVSIRAETSGTYTVDCIKERTVTDWRPFSTHESYDDYCTGNNKEWKYKDLDSILVKTLKDNLRGFKESDASVSMKPGLDREAELHFRNGIPYHYISWPGDHHKDVRGTGTAEVVYAECFIVPCLKVDFWFENRKYQANGIITHIPYEIHDMPIPTNKEKTEQDYEDEFHAIDAKNDKKCDIIKWCGIGALIFGFVLLFVFLSTGLGAIFPLILMLLGLVALIASVIIRKVLFNKYSKICIAAKAGVRTLKQDGLKRYLLDHGYSESDFDRCI